MARRGGGRAPRSHTGSGGGSQKSSASRTRRRGTVGLRRRREVPSVALHGSGGRGRLSRGGRPTALRQHAAARRRRRVASSTIRTRAGSTSTRVKRTWCRSTRATTRDIIMRRPSRSRRFPATRGRRVLPHHRRLDELDGRGAAARRATRPSPMTTRRRRPRPTTEASTASVPPQAPRDQTRCRFFFSARGCKRGAGCWFLHSDEAAEPAPEDESRVRAGDDDGAARLPGPSRRT